MLDNDKPLPNPSLTHANHPTPKQMLYTPFSFRRDRQRQIESSIFFHPGLGGFASANTSVTNLTIPHGHNRRQSHRASVNYRDSTFMAAPRDSETFETPPVPGIPSPYQLPRNNSLTDPEMSDGKSLPMSPPKSMRDHNHGHERVDSAYVFTEHGTTGSASAPIGMAMYDRRTFESLKEQVLNKRAQQNFPVDSEAHSWVFDNGIKCRNDVRERNGSILWGMKWTGQETCVNVYDWDAADGPVFHHALDDKGIDRLLNDTKTPSIRIYFIAETALQDQMSASLTTLSKLFTIHNVPPAYMEIAMMTTSGSCGQRVLYDNSRHRKNARKKVVGYDIYYELRHSFTTDQTHRQLVNLHYDPVRRNMVVFFIGSQIREAQQRVHQIFSTSKKPAAVNVAGLGIRTSDVEDRLSAGGSGDNSSGRKDVEDLLEDPFALITVFLNLTFDDLFQIQAEFDMQVWRLTSDSFSLNNAKPAALTAVHQLASNSLRHATQLSRLFQTSILARLHHHSFLDKITKSSNSNQPDNRNSFISSAANGLDWMIAREVSMGPVSERVSDELSLLLEKSRDLKGWAVEREGIIKNDINLRYNIITQRDARINASIAKDARRDSGSMKAIALLTMLFLPGTFIAALLQLPFLGEFGLQHGWSIYFAVTVPSTLLTLAAWWVWQYRNHIEHKKNYETEEGMALLKDEMVEEGDGDDLEKGSKEKSA